MRKGHDIIGYDTDYYDGCELYPYPQIARQIRKDIREVTKEDLAGVDAIIHLAGLSNDPLGELNAGLTEDINYRGAMQFARCAKEAGVKRFLYASSQSMYGDRRRQQGRWRKTTATKTDHGLCPHEMGSGMQVEGHGVGEFCRYQSASIHGFRRQSEPALRHRVQQPGGLRLHHRPDRDQERRDALAPRDSRPGRVERFHCLSRCAGGTGRGRGVQHRYREWQLYRARSGREAAQRRSPAVRSCLPASTVPIRVPTMLAFKKFLTRLKDYYRPQWNLSEVGENWVDLFRRVNLTEEDFRGRRCIRLRQIRYLLDARNSETICTGHDNSYSTGGDSWRGAGRSPAAASATVFRSRWCWQTEGRSLNILLICSSATVLARSCSFWDTFRT